MILNCNKVTVRTDFGVCYENVEIETVESMPGFCCVHLKDGTSEIVNMSHILRIHLLDGDSQDEEFVVQY